MFFKHQVFVIALLTAATAVTSQPVIVRPTRPRSVRSPQVNDDRSVTFRLKAANADTVIVIGQWPNGRAAMKMDSSGVWSVTVGPVDAGVWEYSFLVDGLLMIDPGNAAIKPMREPRTSILHIAGEPPLLHDYQAVPHGTIHQHCYYSKSLQRLRELTVYTPPQYMQKPGDTFPTLYLQHGMGDNQATWTVHGKAHWIVDNLIARGRAKPMVVVMADGHAASTTEPAAMQNNTALFERDLLEDVMPFVEANYRVMTDAADRAIVGLSMGGGQSLTIGLNHTDVFAWVGGFSAGTPAPDAVATALSDPDAINQKLRLLWIACGKKDFLLRRNEEFIAMLTQHNVHHEWHLTEGDHSWPVWRVYLGEFVPRLF